MDSTILDDEQWEYMLYSQLIDYIPAVRDWWAHYDAIKNFNTGVALFESNVECPPGLMIRMTSTPVRSPIKHIQAFPYLPTNRINMSGVPGGANRMIEQICLKGMTIEEFTIIEKHNLPSTFQKGQWLAFIPTNLLNNTQVLGKYVYLTLDELLRIANKTLPSTVVTKCKKYADI